MSKPLYIFITLILTLFFNIGFSNLESKVYGLAKQGLLDSAYLLSSREVRKNPDDIFYQFMAGKTVRDGKKSLEHFTKTVALDSIGDKKSESLYRIAQYYYAKGSYGMAISFYRQSIQEGKKSDWYTPSLYWMGHSCLNYRKTNFSYLDTAEVYFKKLMKESNQQDYYKSLAKEGMVRVNFLKKEFIQALKLINIGLKDAEPDQIPLFLHYQYEITGLNNQKENQKQILSVLKNKYPHSLENQEINPTLVKHSRLKIYPVKSKAQIPISKLKVHDPPEGPSYLQLGIFSSQANAMQLSKTLNKKGIDTELNREIRKGQTYYIVRTQVFKTEQNARNYWENKLKSQNIPYYVIRNN